MELNTRRADSHWPLRMWDVIAIFQFTISEPVVSTPSLEDFCFRLNSFFDGYEFGIGFLLFIDRGLVMSFCWIFCVRMQPLWNCRQLNLPCISSISKRWWSLGMLLYLQQFWITRFSDIQLICYGSPVLKSGSIRKRRERYSCSCTEVNTTRSIYMYIMEKVSISLFKAIPGVGLNICALNYESTVQCIGYRKSISLIIDNS